MTLIRTPGIETYRELVRQYGSHPLAYSSLQEGLNYFTCDEGYIAYSKVRGILPGGPYRMVLGDPVAEQSGWRSILHELIDDGEDTTFFQISETTARILKERGFHITPFGYEASVLFPFSMKGKYRSDVRRMFNRARAEGVSVRELNAEERRLAGISKHDIEKLVQRWLTTKVVHQGELKFLARPLRHGNESEVRKFYALHHGELCGISVYDPMYRAGEVFGYTESIVRAAPDAPKGTRDLLLCTALQHFNGEGLEKCSLGLSPLAPVPPNVEGVNSLAISRIAAYQLRVIYHLLDDIAFNFKGTEFKKSRYVRSELGDKVEICPVFLASRRKVVFGDAYRLALAMGVSPWRQISRMPSVAARGSFRMLPALFGSLLP